MAVERQELRSSPWLGIGPMQFAALASVVGAHPHNWPLQVAAEWGLLHSVFAPLQFSVGPSIRRSATNVYVLSTLTMAVTAAFCLDSSTATW